MTSLTLAQKGNPLPYVPGALAEYANSISPGTFSVKWQEGSSLKAKDKVANAVITTDNGEESVGQGPVVAYILRFLPQMSPEISQWLTFALEKLGTAAAFKDLEQAFAQLDHHLQMRSYLAGYTVTAADVAVWGALRASAIFQRNLKLESQQVLGEALLRWYAHISTQPFVERLNESLAQLQANSSKKGGSGENKSTDQGKFDLGLENVEDGKVVTRFPPEPSGYLHIGHAKAALLNEYFARLYNGKLIVRFDDTNPNKEKSEFEESITEDLRLLGITADKVSHTSDYFQIIYEYALQLIRNGGAYVDDTEKERIKEERKEGIASRCRDLSVEENLERFEQMRQGTEHGQLCCLRAKISVDCPNKAMRDPVIYRCNLTPHHRTGTAWKIYPTYDFCCPIVDSLEGVTHALRSMEYRDRNPLYAWFFPALNLRPVAIQDFSRMNFVYTLLSKRKLQWFVDQGKVAGWDDPRFPTVRGIRRRGMTIEALRQYVLMQGASQKNMLLEWDKIWALNKKIIDPAAPRHTALLKRELVPVTIAGGPTESYVKQVPKHKKNPELGTKQTVFSPLVFVDQADAATFAVNEEITLMDWGNAIVSNIERTDNVVTGLTLQLHLEGDFKTTKKKITWLGQDTNLHPVEALLVDYDYLITKKKLEEDDEIADVLTPVSEFDEPAIVDANVASLSKGSIIQLERRGYYIVDKLANESELGLITLIKIPDGKASSMASKHNQNEVKSSTPSKKSQKAAKGSQKQKKQDPDAALGLPQPEDVCNMYKTDPMYGDVQLDNPKNISSMYETSKFY
ncbi:glutamate--tRNA ligase [Coemansia brasiliensis]|uniref:glutamate--tRNA ligase n=1 Tax=Coemansia brasiliensis TaxID=2650707 RepID=A0A9W8LWT7_9FUNG|nr:glutamate--tRNA ligase [Coemansia brasiliensis]